MRETPFIALHKQHKGQLVDFAGWNMPVYYTSIFEEHLNVRKNAGLFDISHMRRIVVTGTDQIAFIDHLATNKREGMKPGQIRYNLLCNEQGHILDDILISAGLGREEANENYQETNAFSALAQNGSMIVCNAGNHEKVASWLEHHSSAYDVSIFDLSEEYAMLALQGPHAQEILSPLTDIDLTQLAYYYFELGNLLGVPNVLISRTGYTGEDGFELIFPAGEAEGIFNGLLLEGKNLGLGLAGLGARDTLRLEAGMPLYGHEIDEATNPYEAKLGWAVKLKKNFIGRTQLKNIKEEGPKRLVTGLLLDTKRIARQGQNIFFENNPVGTVASGTKSPTLDKVIATSLLPAEIVKAGQSVEVEIRKGKERVQAKLVDLPFYKRDKNN